MISSGSKLSVKRQCELIGISRSTHYYQPRKPSPEATDRKLIRRYMQEMCICSIYPKPNLSKRNHRESIMPYLLRNMEIYLPNQVWSIDITYVKLHKSHMYLTAIIDWCSRKIMGWTLSETLDTMYVIEAVKQAVAKHGTPGIINSDQSTITT